MTRGPKKLGVGLALAGLGLVSVGIITFPAMAQSTVRAQNYYVSLGDSYSVGYQPGLGATSGYTAYVAHRLQLTLVNFGCAGATTTSILMTIGCPLTLPHTAGAVSYTTTTQAAAAETFIDAHRGHIGAITVSIGGNDVTACAVHPNAVACVADAVSDILKNVTALGAGLRAAAGPRVPILGLTYPDVLLGAYVYPSRPPTAARLALAKTSVLAFEALLNPALTTAYRQAGGVLVDVTAATGAYGSLKRTVTLHPYGTIPVPVARICTLTWYCKRGNIHATTQGYALIGKLIATRYASLRRT